VVDRLVHEALGDALLAHGAASVQTEDADADTPQEQAIYAEPLAESHAEPLAESLAESGAESLAESLAESGAESLGSSARSTGWQRNRLCALFEAQPGEAHAQAARLLSRACAVAALPSQPEWQLRALVEQDWVELTQAQFQPIAVGKRLWISPSWHPDHPPDRTPLILDPGLAFGTGSHPTTRLCLEWLEAHLHGGEEVLDYGCGSGILGIAAALLGAARVQAVDIDPQALRATRHNAQRNRVEACLATRSSLQALTEHPQVAHPGTGDPCVEHPRTRAPSTEHRRTRATSVGHPKDSPPQAVTGDPEGFDIVVANILAAPLMLLAPLLESRLRPGGRIVLAGLLSGQVTAVSACYPCSSPQPWRSAEGWVVLAGQRPHHPGPRSRHAP